MEPNIFFFDEFRFLLLNYLKELREIILILMLLESEKKAI